MYIYIYELCLSYIIIWGEFADRHNQLRKKWVDGKRLFFTHRIYQQWSSPIYVWFIICCVCESSSAIKGTLTCPYETNEVSKLERCRVHSLCTAHQAIPIMLFSPQCRTRGLGCFLGHERSTGDKRSSSDVAYEVILSKNIVFCDMCTLISIQTQIETVTIQGRITEM